MNRSWVPSVFGCVLLTLSGCFAADDVVAELNPAVVPPQEPMPVDAGCPAGSSRLLALSSDGLIRSVEKGKLSTVVDKPSDCLRGRLFAAAFDERDQLWVNMNGDLFVFSDDLLACKIVWESMGEVNGLVFAKPAEAAPGLYGWNRQGLLLIAPNVKAMKPLSQTPVGEIVRSLSLDEKGRILGMVDRKDSVAIGTMDARTGIFAAIWTARLQVPQPFVAGAARDGRFELAFSDRLATFNPATGELDILATTPSWPKSGPNEVLLVTQRCR